MALHEYLGWEAGFTLEKESQTLALVLKESLIVFAFDNRETLMRWQVRSFYFSCRSNLKTREIQLLASHFIFVKYIIYITSL